MKFYFVSIVTLFLIFSIMSINDAAAVGAPTFYFDNSAYPNNSYFSDHGMYIKVSYPSGNGPNTPTINVKITSTVDLTGIPLTFSRIGTTDEYSLLTSYIYFSTSSSDSTKPQIKINSSFSDTIAVQVTSPSNAATASTGVQSATYGTIPAAPPTGPNYSLVIPCSSNGNDNIAIDGICDSWEQTNGLVIHDSGTNSGLGTYSLSCSGATGGCPTSGNKDVYVEYDWLKGHKPNPADLAVVATKFPSHGITLHLQEGEEIPVHRDVLGTLDDCTGGLDTDFEKLKKNYFGTPADRSNVNQLTLKRQVFHYVIFGHGQANGISGLSETNGQDVFITLGGRAGGIGSSDDIEGTFMHELGHNLGLKHSGNTDTPNCEPNYPSVMSHSRQFSNYLGTQILDYSDGDMSNVVEGANLSEIAGVGTSGNGELIVYNYGASIVASIPGVNQPPGGNTGSVNWNNNLVLEGIASPSPNLNYFSALTTCPIGSTSDTLTDYNDWVMLDLVMTDSCGFSDGARIIDIPKGSSFPGCEITNDCYLPNEITVLVNATVFWSNTDTASHTVTSGSAADGASGVFDSGLFVSGATFSHKFEKSGTYNYFCMVHPWMEGVVNVIEPEDSPKLSSIAYIGNGTMTEISDEVPIKEIKQLDISAMKYLIYQINATETCRQSDQRECVGIADKSKFELINDLNEVIRSVESDEYYNQAIKMQDITAKIEGSGKYKEAGPFITDNTIRAKILSPVKTILDTITDNSKPYFVEFIDSDGDGITDGKDNCYNIKNSEQIDSNSNGIGDACDSKDIPWLEYIIISIGVTATILFFIARPLIKKKSEEKKA